MGPDLIHFVSFLVLMLLLQHLRVEENPILEIAHVEAASILLVGPTLKKFNDQGMSIMSSQLVVGMVMAG